MTALDPVLRDRKGVWVCATEGGRLPSRPALGYEVAPVEIPGPIEKLYYGGFSNAILWPVLHSFPATIRLAEGPWEEYAAANEAFAGATLAASRSADLLWVQDYHLTLVPARIRRRRRKARIGWFCHIPWPGVDIFRILPWAESILRGILGADLIGFHSRRYARNFLECVSDLLDTRVELDRGRLHWEGRRVRVGVFPIGIDVGDVRRLATDPEVVEMARSLRASVHDRRVILGVDRLDYTKGIPERLLAYQRTLERKPGMRDEFVFIQTAVPSRTDVAAYRRLKREVDRLVGEINGAFARTGEVAVHYLFQHLPPPVLYAHYRAADVALITPLRDGMNLIAQEYVASRVDEDGVLILSGFAGAAEHLEDALIINPYDLDGVVEAIDRALHMDPVESHRRMRSLRRAVEGLDVHGWAGRFIGTLEKG